MNTDFQPTVSLAEHRITRRVRAGAPAPDFAHVDIASAPRPALTSLTKVLVVFAVGLLIVLPSLALLVRYLVRS